MTVLIDYGAGNTRSVMNALDRIGVEYELTSDSEKIMTSDRLILPGVGHAAAAMDQLNKTNLIGLLKDYKKPFLGVCLGMQLLFDFSEEGNTSCLGIIDGTVRKFLHEDFTKVPHMGWNDFKHQGNHFIFDGFSSYETAYFVHSYYADVSESTIATCDYSVPFSAAVCYKNYIGIQFHPEKSGSLGQKILQNFINFKSE